MNKLIKIIVITSLALSALFVWVTCMIFGFILAFTYSFGFMYDITPLIGVISVFCIIKCAMSVYKSDPMAYLEIQYDRLARLLP